MNSGIKYLGLFALLLIAVSTINGQGIVGANNDVRPINNKLSIDGTQLFYALPKNVVRVTFDVKQIENFQGPYAKYAKKYLNISEGVIFEDDLYYEITDVNLKRYSMADSSQFYAISFSSYVDFPELQLNEDGVILACNHNENITGYDIAPCQTVRPAMETTEYSFTDLGVKPFMKEETQTLYRMVPTDSTPVKESYQHTSVKQTTEEQNAKEAAAFITKLRKRKFKLLSGQFEEVNPVHGEAMAAMIQSLDKLEKKYVELFVGKVVGNTQRFYFDYVPSDRDGAEQKILCWFSPQEGIQDSKPDARKTSFEPILLKSTPVGALPEPKIKMMDNSQKSPTPIKYGLYYRLPGRMDIVLQQFDKVLAKQQIQIAQKGKVVPLPVHYLNDATYGIEFYPETGALKKIHKQKE